MESELSVDEALQLAMRLQREGRFSDAYKIYGRVLELIPEEPHALHYLGIMAFAQHQYQDALLLMRRSVEIAPDDLGFRMNYGNLLFARERYQQAEEQYRAVLASSCDHVETLNNLGVLCKGLGRLDEAAELLSRVTDLRPEFIEARANLASVCLAQGRVEAAIAHFCEILIRDPAASSSRETLGVAYYLLGRIDDAAEVYRAWLAEEPDNAIALHHMSACTGEAVPVRASDEYIRTKFDSFSASFDAKLAELEYRAPELVAQCVATRAAGRGRYEAALDAGCGTGLCGPLLRPLVDELVGVDLSAGMLDRAREREVYDRLDEAELTLYLRANHSSFNLVVSADTLVYFGPLEEVFLAVYGALRPGGAFCFTVEAMSQLDTQDFRLQPHGRYAHGAGYVAMALENSGFGSVSIEPVVLRREANQPVAGWLVLAYTLDQ